MGSASAAKRLAMLSTDCSFLLTHLVRQDSKSAQDGVVARGKLASILDLAAGTPQLSASPACWYSSASNAYYYDPEARWSRSTTKTPNVICFTESTLAGLKGHRDIFNARYGVAFDREWLFNKGANPCLNIREELLKKAMQIPGEQYVRRTFNFIPKCLHPFVNVINSGFDATHEREWRLVDDFSFGYADLKFVFCPETDFKLFSGIQTDGWPPLFDVAWLDRV